MAGEIKIAVMVSGKGTNLKAIIDAQAEGDIGPGRVTLVISDDRSAPALDKARKAGIEAVVIEKGSMSGEEFDALIREEIVRKEIDLIALAGFMKVLGKKFVKEYYGRIINIHPALLPSFKGVSGIADAFDYGVKVTGVTVHFVDEGVDSGPIIIQRALDIEESVTLKSLEEKIHEIEHRIYPLAIRLFAEGKLKIEGRKVKVLTGA
jgi:phosphoribosylglycinamide formyltransferase 1